MSSASARLEAYRLEELRRLHGNLGRLVEAVGQSGKAFVARHPVVVLASAGVVGVLVTRQLMGAREEATASRRRGLPPLAQRLTGFLRTSLMGVLSAALREVTLPGVERAPSVESEVE